MKLRWTSHSQVVVTTVFAGKEVGLNDAFFYTTTGVLEVVEVSLNV